MISARCFDDNEYPNMEKNLIHRESSVLVLHSASPCLLKFALQLKIVES